MRRFLMVLGLVMFLATGSGCMPPYGLRICPVTEIGIKVTLEEEFLQKYGERAGVAVDVVGVREADTVKWDNYSMTDYWKEGDAMHALGRAQEFWLDGGHREVVIPVESRFMKELIRDATDKHPPRVYVLVKYPEEAVKERDDKPERADRRRVIISLKGCELNRGAFDGPPLVVVVIGAERAEFYGAYYANRSAK